MLLDRFTHANRGILLGVSSFWLGEFERSREMLERAIAEYDPLQAHAHIAMYSQDPKAICLIRLAHVRPAGNDIIYAVTEGFDLGAYTFTAYKRNGSKDSANPAAYTSTNFTNQTFINYLDQGQAGRLASSMAGNSTYLCRMVGSALPACASYGFGEMDVTERFTETRPLARDQTLVEHVLRAAEALLAGLEHEQHPAGQVVAAAGEQLGRTDEHGGVRVVAAGVHHVHFLPKILLLRFGCERQSAKLFDRKRIHVRT